MTNEREYNATTVEEAVAKAAEDQGLPPEDLSYEVIDAGSAGFLGLGSRDARISITAGTRDPEPSAEPPSAEPPSAENSAVSAGKDDEPHEIPTKYSPEPDSLEENPPAPEDVLEGAEQFAVEAVGAMGLDARVSVYDAGDFIAVDVASAETGLFIGQKGETIDALQYLLNVAVYKDRPFSKRIIVDSEGYRQRRIEAVQGIAHRMARKASREQRTVELPPMNSSERRVVHLFLEENPSVTTVSQGSGDSRRVTITPAS